MAQREFEALHVVSIDNPDITIGTTELPGAIKEGSIKKGIPNIFEETPKAIHFVDMAHHSNHVSLIYKKPITSENPEHVGAHVHVASYITMLGRMQLFDTIRIVGIHGGRVAYCDTDSIFSTIELPPELVHPTRLGAWKLECKVDDAFFMGAKSYCYKTGNDVKVHLKGIKRSVAEEMIGVVHGWRGQVPAGTKVEMKEGFKRCWGHVECNDTLKIIRSTLNKRKFKEDENGSGPFSNIAETFTAQLL